MDKLTSLITFQETEVGKVLDWVSSLLRVTMMTSTTICVPGEEEVAEELGHPLAESQDCVRCVRGEDAQLTNAETELVLGRAELETRLCPVSDPPVLLRTAESMLQCLFSMPHTSRHSILSKISC